MWAHKGDCSSLEIQQEVQLSLEGRSYRVRRTEPPKICCVCAYSGRGNFGSSVFSCVLWLNDISYRTEAYPCHCSYHRSRPIEISYSRLRPISSMREWPPSGERAGLQLFTFATQTKKDSYKDNNSVSCFDIIYSTTWRRIV